MAVIQELVLTFNPTMHSVQQRKLELLMPVYKENYVTRNAAEKFQDFPETGP